MIVMNPYKYAENHRSMFDQIYAEAVKEAGLSKALAPIPSKSNHFGFGFHPSKVDEMERHFKKRLMEKLQQIKEEDSAAVVYSELIIYPESMAVQARYWFEFEVRYA